MKRGFLFFGKKGISTTFKVIFAIIIFVIFLVSLNYLIDILTGGLR
jgi:preprotein translocase subunit SecE